MHVLHLLLNRCVREINIEIDTSYTETLAIYTSEELDIVCKTLVTIKLKNGVLLEFLGIVEYYTDGS